MILLKRGGNQLKAYKIYKDLSDQFNQAYFEYGFYLSEEKAVAALEKIIREENKYVDEDQISNLKQEWIYEVYQIGFYGCDEIEIIE